VWTWRVARTDRLLLGAAASKGAIRQHGHLARAKHQAARDDRVRCAPPVRERRPMALVLWRTGGSLPYGPMALASDGLLYLVSSVAID
jgi:hypothetical protein